MLATQLTRLFGIRHPLVLAPMAAVAGGALAAAVSDAGGLGLVGGGYGDPEWLERELALVKDLTRGPWGVGLITWSADAAKLERVLAAHPDAVTLSFGDPRPYAGAIKAANCKLICQVQDIASALLAREAGADLVVAQGTEGGGHGGVRSSLPLIPAVIDAVDPIPVIAAGGVADGRGLAAVLALGAQGAMLGTRFCATAEALGTAAAKQCLAAACGDDTQRTHVFDTVRGYAWPGGYTGRALRNRFMQTWEDRQAELAQLEAEKKAFWKAVAAGNYDTAMVWAGEDVDLIHATESASTLVERISADAEAILRRLPGLTA